jgi:murein DD-endopeptidase MepM/ murein hydrolase activator NlpD
MHAPHIRSGEYRYFVLQTGAWTKKSLVINNFRFNQWSAQKIESNLYFAAAILSVFAEQCKDLDTVLGDIPHRHFVSHWFFGDSVSGTEPEDAVLTVRRRIIANYLGNRPDIAGTFNDTLLLSPLAGAPRLLLDYFGNKRGQKKTPGHQGIDIAGLSGEPVYAMASGRISFAGVDLPGIDQSRQMTPKEAATVPRNTLGKGGLWITVNHRNGFRTCYMHLETIAVKEGDIVRAGDIIGTLGNTGTVSSGPHLHLEFRTGKIPLRI